MSVFRSDISNSWWDKLGAFSGFCPLLSLLFRSPFGSCIGSEWGIKMKLELWHLWSYRSWLGPDKGSFTSQDKAKAGMT